MPQALLKQAERLGVVQPGENSGETLHRLLVRGYKRTRMGLSKKTSSLRTRGNKFKLRVG